MDTVELIRERSSALPADLQEAALRYVEYLLARQAGAEQDHGWAQFSASQLAHQYSTADAIYDED
ncbi:MAG: hypothetical protein KJ072_13690 [Verrucomicrobia bacterium]|nr:hypothetical protein [Verrucomicrobiota bacterium]